MFQTKLSIQAKALKFAQGLTPALLRDRLNDLSFKIGSLKSVRKAQKAVYDRLQACQDQDIKLKLYAFSLLKQNQGLQQIKSPASQLNNYVLLQGTHQSKTDAQILKRQLQDQCISVQKYTQVLRVQIQQRQKTLIDRTIALRDKQQKVNNLREKALLVLQDNLYDLQDEQRIKTCRNAVGQQVSLLANQFLSRTSKLFQQRKLKVLQGGKKQVQSQIEIDLQLAITQLKKLKQLKIGVNDRVCQDLLKLLDS